MTDYTKGHYPFGDKAACALLRLDGEARQAKGLGLEPLRNIQSLADDLLNEAGELEEELLDD